MRCRALALVGLFMALAGAVAAAPPDAVSLLRVAARQSERVPYSGRQITVLYTQGRAESTITQEFHSGSGRVRVETRSPRRARGRLILSDGHGRWQYDPALRTAVHTAASPLADELPDPARLMEGYAARVEPAAQSVAGRRTWVVELVPRVDGKPYRRLWIDRNTFVILKLEKRHPDNQPISLSHFTTIRFSRPSPGLFVVRFPPDTRRIERTEELQPIAPSAVEARFKITVPRRLPEGYELTNVRLIGAGAKGAAHLLYQDGLSTLSLFLVPHGGQTPYGSGAARKIALGGGEGRLVSAQHIAALAWRTPHVDCALVGDVSDALLVKLANSTHLTEGARETNHTALPQQMWLAPASLFLLAAALAMAQRRGFRLHRWPPAPSENKSR